jgi:hypothetical protein
MLSILCLLVVGLLALTFVWDSSFLWDICGMLDVRVPLPQDSKKELIGKMNLFYLCDH